MLRQSRSSRAVKLALYMKRFTSRSSSRSASKSSRLKLMFKCRKRSYEIERSQKSNMNKNRSRDVVPLIDRSLSNGGVAEMAEKSDADEDEIVAACDERNSCSGAQERLQNYRLQVAGKVRIPDTWGHEDHLKDWADPTVFDIHCNGLVMQSARTALIDDCAGRREPAAAMLSS